MYDCVCFRLGVKMYNLGKGERWSRNQNKIVRLYTRQGVIIKVVQKTE